MHVFGAWFPLADTSLICPIEQDEEEEGEEEGGEGEEGEGGEEEGEDEGEDEMEVDSSGDELRAPKRRKRQSRISDSSDSD